MISDQFFKNDLKFHTNIYNVCKDISEITFAENIIESGRIRQNQLIVDKEAKGRGIVLFWIRDNYLWTFENSSIQTFIWNKGNIFEYFNGLNIKNQIPIQDKSVFSGNANIGIFAKWSRIALIIGNTNPGISDN